MVCDACRTRRRASRFYVEEGRTGVFTWCVKRKFRKLPFVTRDLKFLRDPWGNGIFDLLVFVIRENKIFKSVIRDHPFFRSWTVPETPQLKFIAGTLHTRRVGEQSWRKLGSKSNFLELVDARCFPRVPSVWYCPQMTLLAGNVNTVVCARPS